MNLEQSAILIAASVVAGAVNSVAGGGTLITFPALIACNFASITANATSTVALWPGIVSSLWGYRKELDDTRKAVLRLGVPSLIGGIVGAFLLVKTKPSVFDHIVPFLILTATVLFMVQEPLARVQKRRVEAKLQAKKALQLSEAEALDEEDDQPKSWMGIIIFQFFVAIYGGYFGAGIGILMLASLGLMGFTNIHRMNGLKNINAMLINAVAALIFIKSGLVQWHTALIMACGAIVGGSLGAGAAKRIGQKNVRRVVIMIGILLTLDMLYKQWPK